MAVDSAEKRRAVSGIGLRLPGVTPNSAKDGEWRQEAGHGYSGIAAVVPDTWIEGYGSAEPERPVVTLALFDETRTERLDLDINSRLTSVIVKTATDKGFDQCQIGIAPPPEQQVEGVVYGQLPEPLDLRAFARAELYLGGHRAFEGRLGPVNQPTTQLVLNGHWRSLYADDWYASSDTTLTSGGEVLKGMLAASTIPIRPAGGDGWQDPVSEHAPVEMDGKTIGDALVQITAEGDALGNDVDWYVWDDRRLHLRSRSEPQEPDYRMAYDPLTMLIFKDPSVRVTRLTVEFRAVASGTATISSGNTSVTVTHGLGVTPDAEDIRLLATNDLGQGVKYYPDNITATTFDIVLVEPERAVGTATVPNGSTNVDVTHGLSRTPAIDELKVNATNGLGNAENWYITSIGASTFRIALLHRARNRGNTTIASGNTSVTVTHGMARTPTADEITWHPTNNPTNDPGHMWVSNIGATTFDLNCRNDPGSGGATFQWIIRFPESAAADPGSTTATFGWEAVLPDTPVASDPGSGGADFGWSINAGAQRTAEAVNATLETELGRPIRRKVNVGAMTLAAAERIRDRLITTLSRSRYTARLRLGPGEHLYGPHGEIRSKETARAGAWGQLADAPALIAVATTYDVTGEKLDVTFGDPLPSLGEQVKRLERAEERRRRGIDPESGGNLA